MSQLKIRTRVMTTATAFMLVPALALAEGDTSQSSRSGEQTPSAEPSTQQGASPSGSTEMGSQHGESTSAQQRSAQSPTAQATIDPAQVQRVFGMDVTLVDLKSLSNDQVRQLQQSLIERGHYKGEADGVVGPKTRAGLTALLAEQHAMNQRLINQGQITQQLASSIGLDTQGRSPVSGVDQPSQMQQPSTSPGTRPPSQSGQQQPEQQQPSAPPASPEPSSPEEPPSYPEMNEPSSPPR